MSRGADSLVGHDLAADQRRMRMLELLRVDGRIDVARVADRFDVARETVRRDLKLLEREGRLERVHGGAVPAQSVPASTAAQPAADAELGRRLWQRLPHAGSMIIGAGRPGCLVAEAMLADPPEQDQLTVVTDSLDAAVAFSRIPQVQVYNLGGTVQPGSHAQQGTWTIAELGRLRCDLALINPDGVEASGGLTARHPTSAAVSEAECASASRVIAMVDASSVGRIALVRFAPVQRLSELIVTGPTDPAAVRAIGETGVEVVALDAG